MWKQYFGTSNRLVQRRLKTPSSIAARQQVLIQAVAEVAKPRPTFATVQSQEEFFAILEAGVAAKKIPQLLLLAFKDFYNNYKSTCKNRTPLRHMFYARVPELPGRLRTWCHLTHYNMTS